MTNENRDPTSVGSEAAEDAPSLRRPNVQNEGTDMLTCTVCGATPARPTGEVDPDLGPVSLCAKHSTRQLDWT